MNTEYNVTNTTIVNKARHRPIEQYRVSSTGFKKMNAIVSHVNFLTQLFLWRLEK